MIINKHHKSFTALMRSVAFACALATLSATPLQAHAQKPEAAVQKAERRFDIDVNSAPASQVYALLAAESGRNIVVPADVQTSISLSLRKVTLKEAIEAIRVLYGHEFETIGEQIYVQSGAPRTKIFKVNYLSGNRRGSSEVRVQSGSISQSSNPNANGQNGNAAPALRVDDSTRVMTQTDSNFWADVKAALETLVGKGGSYVVNSTAGLIVVKAPPSELRQVEEYLKAMHAIVQKQVMIEAKIMEVALNNETSTGINWSILSRNGSRSLTFGVVNPGASLSTNGALSNGSASFGTDSVLAAATGKGFYGLALQASNFAAIFNFLQTQGTVNVLSSPRIATINNQKAVLKVGSDEFFVTDVSSSTTTAGNSTVTNPSVTLQPFFSGIALDVTPQIDDEGNITLHVHPSVSVVNEKQKVIDLGSMGTLTLPLALSTVNETDSIVRLRNGELAAIGGLMLQTGADGKEQIPVLGDMPVVGGLFGQRTKSVNKRELVILIKPTVVDLDQPITEPLPELKLIENKAVESK